MQDFMQHHTHTALFTTASGVVGGVGKAISAKPLLLAITLPGLSTVIIYAAASVEKTLKLTPLRRSKLTPLRRSKLTPLKKC